MLVGPNSKFPFGLGLVAKIPRVVVKKKTRRLGCPGCGPRFGLRGLGDDYSDAQSYAQELNSTVEMPTPTLGPSSGDGFTVATGPTISPSLLQNSPFSNPNTVMQMAMPGSPAALAIGAAASAPPSFFGNQYQAPQSSSAATFASISGYLPLILLGVGGIALLTSLKRRR